MSGPLPDELPPGWDELGREDAAVLAPPAGAKERVQRRVAFTLGLGAGFVGATVVSSTAAAAASVASASAAGGSGSAGPAAAGLAGTLLAKKALVLGVAAAVGIGGGTAAVLEVRSERARSRAATVAPPSRAPIARPQALPTPEPPPAEPMAPDTLGEERVLLDRARADIASGSFSAADSLLVRHAQEFPAGQLAEEREALVIRLLVREGRIGEARVRAARFRQAHPRSIQLPGIADALGERR